jgi:hypothetical protein
MTQRATFTSIAIAIAIARLRVVFDALNTPHPEQEFRGCALHARAFMAGMRKSRRWG